jgi:hypothetical protein
MACSKCQGPVVAVAVPADLREGVGADVVGVCTHCLARNPASEPDADPDWGAFGDAFPDGEAAVPMALVLALLQSVALNRATLGVLVERVEAAGADPGLVLDRLATAGNVQPHYDLRRRRRQLEQLLDA